MAQQNGAKVCQACASTENERQMKRSKGRKDVLRSRKNGKLALSPRNCEGTKFSCQFASLTERGSASFMHSPGLSSVFTRRPPPRFEAASPAPEFLQAYPQPRPNCTGWLLP